MGMQNGTVTLEESWATFYKIKTFSEILQLHSLVFMQSGWKHMSILKPAHEILFLLYT